MRIKRLIILIGMALVFTACGSTNMDVDELPESVARAPANPADPSNPEEREMIDEDTSPANELDVNRGLDMPALIQTVDTIPAEQATADDPAAANLSIRFDNDDVVAINQVGLVQGGVLMANLDNFEGVTMLDETLDYVLLRVTVDSGEGYEFRATLNETEVDNSMTTSFETLGQIDNTLYLISEQDIADVFFLETLEIIAPNGQSAFLDI